MNKRFDQWNQRKKTLETYKTEKIAKNIQEGAIYWVSIGVNVGNEMHSNEPPFNRPVLVYKVFKDFKTFLGIPLTSRTKRPPYFFEFTDSKGVTQYACLTQSKSFDYRRIVSVSKSRSSEISNEDFMELKKRFVTLIQ